MRAQMHSATSIAAAMSIESSANTLRGAVYRSIREGRKTDEELQHQLGMNPSTERPRRIELIERGLIRDSGLTRPTMSGRQAVIWEVVPRRRRDNN